VVPGYPASAVLARGLVAATAFADALETGAVAIAAELLGSMERMFELTLDYLRSRRQFGRSIGSFQALQHKAVDMWVQLKLAEAAVDAAVRLPAGRGPGQAVGVGEWCEGKDIRVRAADRQTTASSCTARSVSPTSTSSATT